MDHEDNSIYQTHDDVFMLLPWHVNGTLDENERKLVERHLKVCLACRIELKNLNEISMGMSQPSLDGATASASFSNFKRQFQQTTRPHKTQSAPLRIPAKGLADRCGDWWWQRSQASRKVPVGLLGFLLSFAVLFAGFVNLSDYLAPKFSTFARFDTLEQQHHDIRVVFTQGLGQKQIEQILGTIHGEMIEGPNSRSAVRVRLIGEYDQYDHAIAAITLLRKLPDVIFAEPVFGLSSAIAESDAEK